MGLIMFIALSFVLVCIFDLEGLWINDNVRLIIACFLKVFLCACSEPHIAFAKRIYIDCDTDTRANSHYFAPYHCTNGPLPLKDSRTFLATVLCACSDGRSSFHLMRSIESSVGYQLYLTI